MSEHAVDTIGVRDNKSFFYYYVRNQPGHVRDIAVNGLYADVRAPNESRMEGFDATHLVSNFSVKNMYVAGVAMNTMADIPLVKRNAFVSNIVVTPPGADGTPLVQVTAPDDYAVEGTDDAHFAFSRAGSLVAPLTVYFTSSGTATPGTDYASIGTSITFPSGVHQVELAVSALADALNEGEETLVLRLAQRADYRTETTKVAAVMIADGATEPSPASLPVVTVVVEDGSSSEATSPVNSGRFRVARSGALDAPLTVSLAFRGTATNGVDYEAMDTSVTIPAGEDQVKLLILPIADGLDENHEKVHLDVVPSDRYQAGTQTASLTILNVDDVPTSGTQPVVTVMVEDGSSSESVSPANTGRFRVSRTGALNMPLVVSLAYTGTATNGVDYVDMSSTVTIPAGEDRVKLLIVPIADGVRENHEKVHLNVVAADGYRAGTQSASLTILNVDP